MKKIYFMVRSLADLIPAYWKALDSKYAEVGLFWTNDETNYKKYRLLKGKIAKLINPLYKLVK